MNAILLVPPTLATAEIPLSLPQPAYTTAQNPNGQETAQEDDDVVADRRKSLSEKKE